MATAAVLPPRQHDFKEQPFDRWLSKTPPGYQENPAPEVVPFQPIKVGSSCLIACLMLERVARMEAVIQRTPTVHSITVASNSLSVLNLQGPTVWYSDLPREQYEYKLTTADIADLDAAIEGVKARGVEKIETITRADFELGKFGLWLDDLHKLLVYGTGLKVVRGLPVERWGIR